MPKTQTSGSLALVGFNDIFSGTAKADDESVTNIPLSELHPPEFHPFQLNDDEAMRRLVKSIGKYGVREPGLARPRAQGGYELLCGNRRKMACELAGLPTMPVIIRELDDDNSAIAMVDSNLQQRDKILPSEKAWAYRIKLEAMNHRGVKGDKLSVEVFAEQTGESKNKIFRIIRLTELVIGLLDRLDTKQLAFSPAVELSYLSQSEQIAVVSAMEVNEVKPSLSQAMRLKKLKQAGELTEELIHSVLSEEKSGANSGGEEISRFHKFFPPDYTPRQMDKVITDLLLEWQSKVCIGSVLPAEA